MSLHTLFATIKKNVSGTGPEVSLEAIETIKTECQLSNSSLEIYLQILQGLGLICHSMDEHPYILLTPKGMVQEDLPEPLPFIIL